MRRRDVRYSSLYSWLLGALFLGTMAYAIAEEITLTTYYPSPRGVYKELRVTDNAGIGTTDPGTAKLAVMGGNVGIGTTSPRAALHLGGLGGTLLSEAPTTLLMGDTRSGPIDAIPIWVVGNSGDRFYVDRAASLGATGYNYLSIQPNGSVALPEGRAVIGGQIQRRTYAAGNAAVEIQSRNSVFLGLGSIDQGFPGVHQWLYVVNDPASGYTGLISTKDGSASYLPLAFHVGGAERMRIDPSGNVGIGTTTPSANATLEVVGGVKATRLALGTDVNLNTLARIYGANGANPASWPLLFITEDAPLTSSGPFSASAFRVDHNGGAAPNRTAIAISGTNAGTAATGGTNVGGYFDAGGNTTNYGLLVRSGTGANDFAIVADNPNNKSYFAGKVGIGTTGPGDKLHVEEGNILVRRASSPQIQFVRNDVDITDGEVISQVNFKGLDSAERFGGLIVARAVGTWGATVPEAGTRLEFWTEDAGTATTLNSPRMVVSDVGNVGIGTTTPTRPLHMASGAHVTTGGVWTDASSIQYKQDVASLPLDKAVETLLGLNPVTFRYKNAKDEKHVGFIAEEVPELVASQDRKGLSPMDIIAVLVKVVQEQQRELDTLKRELEALKTRQKANLR